MDLPVIQYKREQYVDTASGNKIFKNQAGVSTICGTQNIVLNGKSIIEKDVVLRGDMAPIRSGKYCMIRSGTVIRPSYKRFSRGVAMFPVHIGDHVMIEENCVISAAQVCSFVHVGAGSVIGRGAIIKECCRLLPGTVVPPEAVFPPFSTIAGSPARLVGQEPECTEDLMTFATKQFYDNFVSWDSARTPYS